jgi:hypothetical protein
MSGTKRTSVLLCVGLLAALGGRPLPAQVTEEILSEPEAIFPEAFALVQGLQELPDGRVMVADPLGQTLVIADMVAGTADTLGGVGQGPAEYRQPDGLFPLPGGATLLVDLGNARLTQLGPDGSFGETMPIAQGEPGTGSLQLLLPRGTDSRGAIYFRPMPRPGPQLPDSAAVARWDRAAGAMDTVTRVKIPAMRRSVSGAAGNQAVSIMPIPLSPEDAWAVSWDGRVVVARCGDYHVEWIHPDGRVVRGAPLQYEPVRVRRADKEEWAESLGNGINIGINVQNNERRISMSRGGDRGDGPDLDSLEWPDQKPPFVSNGVWVTPEGEVWVQRSVPAGQALRFDVFGGDAELEKQVSLPAGRSVVGFGRSTVYAVRTDDMGLQWLERYKRSTI